MPITGQLWYTTFDVGDNHVAGYLNSDGTFITQVGPTAERGSDHRGRYGGRILLRRQLRRHLDQFLSDQRQFARQHRSGRRCGEL